MPLYEFECKQCQHQFEDICAISDPWPPCPECKTPEVKKLISLPAPGKVELTGRELSQSLYNQAGKDMVAASRNENKLANMVGESKYQSNVIDAQNAARNNPKSKIKRAS